MSDIQAFIVDSFSDTPFSGNPAAVCLIPHGKNFEDATFYKISEEMKMSQTSIVEHLSESSDFAKDDTFRIRWFTPTREYIICGHGTLATAAVLFKCAGNTKEKLKFQSKSGPLTARRHGDAITIEFPLNPVQPYDRTQAQPIIKELCDESFVSDVQYNPTIQYLVLRLKDGQTRDFVEKLEPDARSLQAKTAHLRAVIVTARTDTEPGGYDFVSRFWYGGVEDPVTGSAHTVLADYWKKEFGKSTFKARQCSKRGGDVIVNIVDERVQLTGNATVVLRGTIVI